MGSAHNLARAIREQGVLVVDHIFIHRQAAIGYLRRLSVNKIFEAGNGIHALHLVRSTCPSPAVIMFDLDMPGGDGIEMTQQLAAEGLRPSLLLASSADPSILDVVEKMIEALGLPMLGVLRKPLVCQEIAGALARFDITVQADGRVPVEDASAVCIDALRRAIDDARIVPFYQPKIRIEDGRVTGVEALARWLDDSSGRTIRPARFIALAEQNGLIERITLLVLDAVLRDLCTWRGRDFHPTVAINVSAALLADRAFVNELIGRVDAAGIAPGSLIVEITESALLGDLAASLGALGRLRLKGCGLSIDDYGTGFSSMQQLARLPFTELKIDRSFVRHAHEKWQLRTILGCAISMARRLSVTTVAEGIESREELELLRAFGCDYAQGYLIAEPMCAASLISWVQREHDGGDVLRAEQRLVQMGRRKRRGA